MWASLVEVVFAVAIVANAVLFIPQIIRLYQKKDASQVSLLTFAGFNVIQIFTILHGIIHQDYWIIIGFVLSFAACAIVTGMIIYYRLVK
ncbi:MAG TPA: PQ-loop domain-containing transporter [Gammaproteobacteria bacterium]|nr:PQ-loop domain-containing transporter [Gammaproteobacteria bacterium]